MWIPVLLVTHPLIKTNVKHAIVPVKRVMVSLLPAVLPVTSHSSYPLSQDHALLSVRMATMLTTMSV